MIDLPSGTAYVLGAYLLTALVLGGYFISLLKRGQAVEREWAALQEDPSGAPRDAGVDSQDAHSAPAASAENDHGPERTS